MLAAAHANDAVAGLLTWTGPPPGFPPIEDCVDLGQWRGTTAADGTNGYAAQVEVLMDPATTGWRQDEPSGLPEMRGYFRLRDGQDPDPYVLALAVDGLPPVVFGLGATGWAPTVELTWHMRAVPCPGPLAVAARARHVSGGWFDEEAEVWDASGRLVAQSRQMARVGRGRIRTATPMAQPPIAHRRRRRGRAEPGAVTYGTLLIRQTKIEPRAATTAVPANSVG